MEVREAGFESPLGLERRERVVKMYILVCLIYNFIKIPTRCRINESR